MPKPVIAATLLLALLCDRALATEETERTEPDQSSTPVDVPDLREQETRLKFQRGDIVVVPIPMSNPTLDSGLVLGGAYFYPQTEQQKAKQPASLTAAAGMYTSNKSFAYGVAQQSYWGGNKWRFNGVVAHADLKLPLLVPIGDGLSINWQVKGNFLQAGLSRRVRGKWFAGATMRYMDINQSFDVGSAAQSTSTQSEAVSVGLGVDAEFDSRDLPFNPYAGRFFEIDALFNGAVLGGSTHYQSYSLRYRSYHRLAEPVVLAWEVSGCSRSGEVPLWDACFINLRGFPLTEYIGDASVLGQAEGRWQFHPRWGVVAFAGGGYVENAFSQIRDREIIPSYGIGIRFTALKSQRINVRLDYGRSTDSDAVYLMVGEAF